MKTYIYIYTEVQQGLERDDVQKPLEWLKSTRVRIPPTANLVSP